MWSLILPIILPATVKLIAFFYDKKVLSDSQRQAFLDFVQAMATESNESSVSHQKFKDLHDKLKGK